MFMFCTYNAIAMPRDVILYKGMIVVVVVVVMITNTADMCLCFRVEWSGPAMGRDIERSERRIPRYWNDEFSVFLVAHGGRSGGDCVAICETGGRYTSDTGDIVGYTSFLLIYLCPNSHQDEIKIF